MTPRHLLLRALRVLAALVLLVVVLRAVVVPLARQRQHRRVEAPTLLALRLWGDWFALASDSALLASPPWLDAQARWVERDDLLLEKDWLEFRRAGAGGAVLGVESVLDRLLAEGLAWDCADGLALLVGLGPGPVVAEAVPPAALDSLPLLRHSGPFAPDGLPLAAAGALRGESDALGAAERRWQDGDHAALARVIWLR